MTKLLNIFIYAAISCATSASFAYECKTLEAQFGAIATSIESINTQLCHTKLSFKRKPFYYNPNRNCPLDIDEVLQKGIFIRGDFTNSNCRISAGDEISGVLIKSMTNDDERIYLE